MHLSHMSTDMHGVPLDVDAVLEDVSLVVICEVVELAVLDVALVVVADVVELKVVLSVRVVFVPVLKQAMLLQMLHAVSHMCARTHVGQNMFSHKPGVSTISGHVT